MTLPASGGLAFSDLNTEVAATSSTTALTLNDYRVRVLSQQRSTGSPIAVGQMRGRSYVSHMQWTPRITRALVSPYFGSGSSFGAGVAITPDGNTMVITDNSVFYTSGGHTYRGAALVYTKTAGVFGSPVILTPTYNQTGFGFRRDQTQINDAGTRFIVGNEDDGVWVFDLVSGSWVATLIATPTSNITFGFSCDMSADGNTIVVSATGEKDTPTNTQIVGAIYIYTWSGSSWSLAQKIKTSATPSIQGTLGFKVAISSNGNVIAADDPRGGGTSANEPSLTIYRKSGSTWAQEYQVLQSVDWGGSGAEYNFSLSRGGAEVLAAFKNGTSDVGSFTVHQYSGGTWSRPQTLALPADITATNFFYGAGSMRMSNDGNFLAEASIAGAGAKCHMFGKNPVSGLWFLLGAMDLSSMPASTYPWNAVLNSDGSFGVLACKGGSGSIVASAFAFDR